MTKRVILSLVLIIILVGGASTVYYGLVETKPLPPKVQNARPTLAVDGLHLERETVIEPIVGYGSAEPHRAAQVTARVSGPIVDVAPELEIGVAVTDGQVLARIDERDYQAALARAKSQLEAERAALRQIDVERENTNRLIGIARTEAELAEREYNRVRDLLEQGRSSSRELDQFRITYEQATRALQTLENQLELLPERTAIQRETIKLRESDVELAELDLERTTIVAPFDGRIVEVNLERGEQVLVGTALFSIVDRSRVEIALELPASMHDRVRTGAGCAILQETRDDIVWQGAVARLSPIADRQSRTFSAIIEVDNRSQQTPLLPGMFVRARIDGPTLADVVIVPRRIVQRGQVFLFDDGTARRIDVRVVRNLVDRTVIGGLDAGQVVITSNLDALFDGAPVRLTESAHAGAEQESSSPGVQAARKADSDR